MHIRQILPILVIAIGSLTARGSHDESIGARFVQPGGVDVGNCLDHDTPCRSMEYALAQAEPGNTVKVGVGIFDLGAIDPESFLYGRIRATGGYSDTDHFLESRPDAVQSVITGVDARYRNALAVRGFHWAADAEAARRGEFTFGGGAALQEAQALPTTCTQGLAGQFPCRNIDFQSQIPLNQFSSQPVSAANVWGFVDRNDNREYALLGLRNGTAVVDVTDPANPREVRTIAGNSSAWREVKVYQYHDTATNRWRAYAYVSTEAANSGMQVIDLSGLPDTAALATTIGDTGSQHTLYVSNIEYAGNTALLGAQPVLYVAGANLAGGAWRAYNLANPASPQLISVAPSNRYMHDSTSLLLTDARTSQCAPGHNPCEVLIDFNVNQVEIWDVTDKLQPELLSTATNPNNRYIHSGWPSTDQGHVFFHDELEEIQLGLNTRIYTLDLTNLRAPTVLTSYTGNSTTTDHNGYTRGNYYYVSHYRRGVVVFDAANPAQLVEVAHFDNYLTPDANVAGTEGAWGVYPFLPSGNILVSDIENGLFVLRDHVQNLASNAGRLGFAELALTVSEASALATVRVQRVAGTAGAVSVAYSVTGVSATAGSDFTASSGTLNWAAGDMSDRTISIALADDTSVEGSEVLRVTLANAGSGAGIDGSSAFDITLSDNDTAAPAAAGGGGGALGDLGLAALLLLWLSSRRRRHWTAPAILVSIRACRISN